MKNVKLIICITILMSMIGTKALAYDIAAKNADGVTIYYNYTNNNTELEVTNYDKYYNEYTGNVVIPESVTYNGSTYSVTSIGDDAFYRCRDLTSVTISDSVTSIGRYAFFSCSGLTSVSILGNMKTIGYYAFYGCTGLKKVIIKDIAAWCRISFAYNIYGNPLYYAKHLYSDENTEIANLIIPDSVTSIGSYAFWFCI